MKGQPLRRRIQSIQTIRSSIVSVAMSQDSLPAEKRSQSFTQIKLHFQPNKQIEQSFKKYVEQERYREQVAEQIKATVSRVGRRLNSTEAMVKSAVVEHCRTNQTIKNDEDIMELRANFSRSKTDQSEFQRKFQRYRERFRRPINRDKLQQVISKSREKYQKSHNANGSFNINSLVKKFCQFEELCRTQRRPVRRRLMDLQNISQGIGLSSTCQAISIDEYLKSSRIVGGVISPSK